MERDRFRIYKSSTCTEDRCSGWHLRMPDGGSLHTLGFEKIWNAMPSIQRLWFKGYYHNENP